MIRQKKLVLLCLTILTLQIRCADKYTDENRPYEFGFSIDGEQHRHEKKDENGIIMGEFGFITADGVYHVTVYATDENGGFKILSMKNIRVKPYPNAKTGAEKGRSLDISSSPPASQQPATPEEKSPPVSGPQKPGPASPAKSCSHCSIPTTTTTTTTTIAPFIPDSPQQIPSLSREPDVLPKIDQYPQNSARHNFNSQTNSQPPQSQRRKEQNYPHANSGFNQNYSQAKQSNENYPQQSYPQNGNEQLNNQVGSGKVTNTLLNRVQPNYQEITDQATRQVGSGNVEIPPEKGAQPAYQDTTGPGQSYAPVETNTQNQEQNSQFVTNRNPKSYGDRSQQQQLPQEQFNTKGFPSNSFNAPQDNQPNEKPQLISAQMQIVDKNTDIYYKRPGEKDGLPNGLNKDDMANLLYTFNYTVGFHGHVEEGYKSGAKQGYYYVTGRNGVRTRIDYVADERGFRPKITQEVLDLLSDEVPKPETEKDPKYGLKGYEFKWIYYPVDSSRR